MAWEYDPDKSETENAARILADDFLTLPKQIAEIQGTGYGMVDLTRDTELGAWAFEDEAVDVAGLRMAGHSDADIAKMRFPLRQRLLEQAGLTFDEQKAYADRMAARWLRARAQGRTPGLPPRPPQTLKG